MHCVEPVGLFYLFLHPRLLPQVPSSSLNKTPGHVSKLSSDVASIQTRFLTAEGCDTIGFHCTLPPHSREATILPAHFSDQMSSSSLGQKPCLVHKYNIPPGPPHLFAVNADNQPGEST